MGGRKCLGRLMNTRMLVGISLGSQVIIFQNSNPAITRDG